MLSLEQRSGCPRLPRPNLNGTVRAALVKRATRVLHEAVGDLLPQDGSGVVDARVYAREGYSALYNTVTRYISPAVRPNPFDAPETDAEEAAPKAVPAPAAPAKDGEAAAAVGDKAAPLPAAAAASSSVSGLVFTGSDLAMDGFDGDLSGSYLCLNYLAGYGPLEVFVQGRDIVKDLAQWS
uniref:Uncharacterized protein n=2 Tax=Phaeomonas parva TaxID=124430 RepID=A0A7S1XXM3_9STRA|mmetsp:Transcript_42559/g.133370  ORF Transcript_42559/g.133370 Transcript_42559/m.133370 type:complete len:181 (+) Transcript_42559:1652-2194(+)